MIVGLGTDLVEVQRMEAAMARHGDRLTRKILSEAEQLALPEALRRAPGDPDKAAALSRLLAKRFAAKEAVGKALRLGLRWPASLSQQSIVSDALGAPRLIAGPALQAHLDARGLTIHLSLSDERSLVMATALAEQRTSV